VLQVWDDTKERLSNKINMQLASFSIIGLWLMLFYWLRLFSGTAFYVKLIIETVVDASSFVFMFFLGVFMFGNAVYALNQLPVELDGADEPQINLTYFEAFDNPFLDSTLHQYRLGLGDLFPESANYSEHPTYILLWTYFILAAFFINILFLNMLIATMGQTFNRVVQSSELSALKESSQMYSDFLWLITLTKELENQRYLYFVRPVKSESNEEADKLQQIQKQLTSSF
jgi:hypothetical protein